MGPTIGEKNNRGERMKNSVLQKRGAILMACFIGAIILSAGGCKEPAEKAFSPGMIVFSGKLVDAKFFRGGVFTASYWELRFEDGTVYLEPRWVAPDSWQIGAWYERNKHGQWRKKE